MPKHLTDLEIAATIMPTMLRWPAVEIAKTVAWDRLRDCGDALRNLVTTVNDACVAAEQDPDLSPDGVRRRVTETGRKALTELQNYKPFVLAEKSTAENLTLLEKRMVDLPPAPTNVADVILAQEIRQYVAEQNSPVDFVFKNLSDARVLGPVLNAPCFLSGLTDAQWNMIREKARAVLHPTQTEMQAALAAALADVREGVAAAKRLLLARCEIREDRDGKFRGIREPLPGGVLAAAKSAA